MKGNNMIKIMVVIMVFISNVSLADCVLTKPCVYKGITYPAGQSAPNVCCRG